MSYRVSPQTQRLKSSGHLGRSSWRAPAKALFDGLSALALIAAVALFIRDHRSAAFITMGAAALIFGVRELFVQDGHALVRIYGPLGRVRYLFEEDFRDKFLQYFNERNMDGRPIPRIVRDYIYQKSKGIHALTSFGSELDNFDTENTVSARILHHNFGAGPEVGTFSVEVGAHRGSVRSFEVTSAVNISAMSFGSINQKAAECLSLGAKGIAFVNTGEGGYGPHGIAGNDVVFQIGTGKFGVGRFETLAKGGETRVLDEQLLVETVRKNSNIRMIQIKLSQGAKPGIGGHLPGAKVTPAIAAIRRIPVGRTVISPDQHAELLASSPREAVAKLMAFCARIRELTGLPVGIKMCVGQLKEIDLLVSAMADTDDGPDAIQIDGADGGTGAGPNLFVNYVGHGGAIESLALLDAHLRQAGIRDQVRLSASGKLFTPVHAAVAFAFGADWIESARGPMLALGCIQSLHCHTNQCPTGITTNSKWRMHGLDIPEKSIRIQRYLQGFNHDMLELTRVLHHADPRDISREDLRIITYRDHFAGHFDHDPFGVQLPSPRELQDRGR